MLSDQNFRSRVSILYTFDIDKLSLNPRTAPISSRRGILVAFSGATLDLDATIRIAIFPLLYSHLE